jgi:hypothetical protein
VHEQRSSDGDVPLLVAQSDAAPGLEGGDDELDVVRGHGN